jgi:hypothetical protein
MTFQISQALRRSEEDQLGQLRMLAFLGCLQKKILKEKTNALR